MAQRAAKPSLGLLRFKAEGSQVTLQHKRPEEAGGEGRRTRGAVPVPTLRVDLKTAKVWLGSAPPLADDCPVALGLVGLMALERGAILALVTKASRVCGLLDGPVYKVEACSLVAPESINACPNDLRHASLLQEALNPKQFGGHLYFSHTANITTSRQRQAEQEPRMPLPPGSDAFARPHEGGQAGGGGGGARPLGPWWEAAPRPADPAAAAAAAAPGAAVAAGYRSRPLWSRSDPRFVWNGELMRPLIAAGAEAFALPLLCGYVGQATGATFELRSRDAAAPGAGAGAPGELTLITRLGVARPVASGWRRGADRQGHTAGFSETEVVLTLWQPEGQAGGGGEDAAPAATAESMPDGSVVLRSRCRVAVGSYVMVRGSVPLYWAAPPNLRPCPAPRGPEAAQLHAAPLRKHVAALERSYGQHLLLLNLVAGAQRGPQLRLHDALAQQVAALATGAAAQPDGNPASTTAAGADNDGTPDGGGGGGGGGGGVRVRCVGLPLSGSDQAELASYGGAAARLERACGGGEGGGELGRIGAYAAVDELEITITVSAAAAAAPAAPGKPPGGGSRSVHTAGRLVHCRQRGVVAVSSASAASAGGCCEEVDLAQHALALPALAALLVGACALDDPEDIGRAHASVMQALAVLWANMADVLSDQLHGTASAAGRRLRTAAAALEQRGLGRRAVDALLRAPWRAACGAGDCMSRYYYAQFTDARRQDAVDLASGAYKLSCPPAELPRHSPPSTSALQLGILLLLAALAQAVICALWPPAGGLQDVAMRVGAPGAVCVLLLGDVLRRGTAYLEAPALLPGATHPWLD